MSFRSLYRSVVLLLAIAFLWTHCSPAQQPTAKLSVTTRLIEVSVVVDDKKGHPISDLTQDDFHIFDQGHEQSIARFEFVSSYSSVVAPLDLPSHVYTNLPGPRSSAPNNVTIILLDRLNTNFVDQSWSKLQVVKYLQHIQPHDRIALYTLGSDLRVVHDFTSDASTLVAALDSLQSRRSPQIEEPAVPDPEKNPAVQQLEQGPQSAQTPSMLNQLITFLNDANNQDISANLDERVRLTLHAFIEIAGHVAGFPGRKNLLWVSGAFPIQFNADIGSLPGHQYRDYGESIERATQVLSSANVAVYPVDARGLIPENLGTTAPMLSSRRDAVIPTLPQSMDPNDMSTMNEIAHNTGGRAFFNTNDIEKSISRAIDDARISYVLGYYLDNAQWDGKFHEIKVKVDRPGVDVRARPGYLAIRSAPLKEKDQGEMLFQIAASPLESTGVPLFARIDYAASKGSHDSVNAFMAVDPRGLTFTLANGRWTGHMLAAFIPLDPQGAIIGGGIIEQTVDMNLLPETYKILMRDGLKLEKTLPLTPKTAALCIVALDQVSGKAGSIHIPLSKYQPKTQSPSVQ